MAAFRKGGGSAFQDVPRSRLRCTPRSLTSHSKQFAKERPACSRFPNWKGATDSRWNFHHAVSAPAVPLQQLVLHAPFLSKPPKTSCKRTSGMFTLSETAFRWRSFLPCRKRPLSGRKPTKRSGGFLCGNLCCMPRSLASRQKHLVKERPVCPRFPLAFLSAVPQAPAFRKKTNEALRRFPPRRLRRRKHYDASSSLTDTMRDTPRSSIATP